MPFKKHNRQYDLVVLGATGYTGTLTAEHIATNLPTDLKWAVAGRSEDKLKQVVSDCQALRPDRVPPAVEVCNANDEEVSALAQKTFCLITTLGPYIRYGEHAFKACAEGGTHYLDCTGEVPFTLAMIKKYEATAKASGAWMFPQSGLESAPSDLLTWALVSTIRSRFSSPTGDVVLSLCHLDSLPSGGTLASFLNMFDAFSARVLLQAIKPYSLSPVMNDHQAPKKSFTASATGLIKVPGLGLMSTSATGAMNAAIVSRSWGLTKQSSQQHEFYGPNFTYREYMKARNFLFGALIHYGLIMGAVLLLCSPVRSLMQKFIFKPGDGPDKDKSKKDYIELQAVGKPDCETGKNKQVFGKLSYNGSMYYLTAAILAQGAATILQDDAIHLTGGIYTPACLGKSFVDRLGGVGIELETEIRDS